jgi:hypothetical protein
LREFGEIEELATRYPLKKEIIRKKIGENAKKIGRKNRKIKNVQTMSFFDVAVRWHSMKLCYLTGLVEPCGALPRKCLFIYLLEEMTSFDSPTRP